MNCIVMEFDATCPQYLLRITVVLKCYGEINNCHNKWDQNYDKIKNFQPLLEEQFSEMVSNYVVINEN